MAEFCKECYEKIFEDQGKNKKIVISKKCWDLCEGCGEVKPVVIKVRKKWLWEK